MLTDHFNSSKIAVSLEGENLSYASLGALIKRAPPITQIKAELSLETIIAILSAFYHNRPLFLENPHAPSWPKIPEDPGLYFSTSGSSGSAKIAYLTFESLLKNAQGVNDFLGITDKDVWLPNLPLFHVAGVGSLLRMILAHGSLSDHPTVVSLVPTQLYRLLAAKKEDKTIKYMIGGAPLSFDLQKEAIERGLNLYLSYGMTEMGSTITLGLQTLGKPLKGRSLSFGPDSEILVSGETLFNGYVKEGTLIKAPTPFPTQDIGRLDEEGNLIILGRKDRMFIKGGENIHPEEIENALLSLTGVKEAVVISVKDREYGEVPIAFISAPPFCETEILSRLNLPKFKLPQKILNLPPYSTLKVNRALLKTMISKDF